MIHPDLVDVARRLVEGAFAPLPPDRDGLTEALYVWYLNVSPLPAATGPLQPHELGMPAVLRTAHHDATRFEGGWRAETVSTHGRVVAKKGELSRVLDRSEYTVPARRGLRAEPRDALLVSHGWEWIDEETGFWYLRRGSWPPPGADRLLRLYFNCAPAEAAAVMGGISRVLAADAAIPYMFKTPAAHEQGGRADALVLYLGPDGFAALEGKLRATAATLASSLRPETPRLTLPLGRGVALAEGPLDGDSFGEVRCRLVAGAWHDAADAERERVSRLAARLANAFTAAGLDPAEPHREPRRP